MGAYISVTASSWLVGDSLSFYLMTPIAVDSIPSKPTRDLEIEQRCEKRLPLDGGYLGQLGMGVFREEEIEKEYRESDCDIVE